MAKAIEHDFDTGEVRITFGGKTYRLRPPTIGQSRELDLLAETIDRESALAAEEKAAKALAENEELDAVTLASIRRLSPAEMAVAVMPWWRRLFESCGDAKQQLPPDEDCPLWFGSSAIVGRLQAFWVLYPFVALGPLAPDPMTSLGSSDVSG